MYWYLNRKRIPRASGGGERYLRLLGVRTAASRWPHCLRYGISTESVVTSSAWTNHAKTKQKNRIIIYFFYIGSGWTDKPTTWLLRSEVSACQNKKLVFSVDWMCTQVWLDGHCGVTGFWISFSLYKLRLHPPECYTLLLSLLRCLQLVIFMYFASFYTRGTLPREFVNF